MVPLWGQILVALHMVMDRTKAATLLQLLGHTNLWQHMILDHLEPYKNPTVQAYNTYRTTLLITMMMMVMLKPMLLMVMKVMKDMLVVVSTMVIMMMVWCC